MKQIKIHHLHAGHVRVAPALPFGNDNFFKASGVFTPVKDKIWLPVSAVYIEHPKAKILVDTGWNRAISPDGTLDKKSEIAHLSIALYIASAGYVEKGMTVVEQLDTLGVKPNDLDYVILSHLDCDHVSGLSSLVGAKKVITSSDEVKSADNWFNSHTRYTPRLWENTGLETFEYVKTR